MMKSDKMRFVLLDPGGAGQFGWSVVAGSGWRLSLVWSGCARSGARGQTFTRPSHDEGAGGGRVASVRAERSFRQAVEGMLLPTLTVGA